MRVFSASTGSFAAHAEHAAAPFAPTRDPMRRVRALSIIVSRVVRSAANVRLAETAASMASESGTATSPLQGQSKTTPTVTRSSCGGYDVEVGREFRQMLNLQPRSCWPFCEPQAKPVCSSNERSGLDK